MSTSRMYSIGTRSRLVRSFNSSSVLNTNRILDAVRIPPTFHDYLRQCSASNTLLLSIFTTSACAPCKQITPLLKSITESRRPQPSDSFSSLAFAEVELDSPDTSNGSMMEIGMLYGVNSLPTLIGFGGCRAERVTDRLTDTKMMCDKIRMQQWIDEQMQRGDTHPPTGGIGKAVFDKFFA